MKTVCTFCNTVIRGENEPDDEVSHGVCPSCYREILTRHGFNARKFLELFDAPVLLVDGDARVLAANHLALVLSGKSAAAMHRQYCGDVLECVNAFLENGCGKTRFCPDCIFRASVTETYATGRPVTDRPATLCRRNADGQEEVRMLVSTRRDNGTVLLRLRRADGSLSGTEARCGA